MLTLLKVNILKDGNTYTDMFSGQAKTRARIESVLDSLSRAYKSIYPDLNLLKVEYRKYLDICHKMNNNEDVSPSEESFVDSFYSRDENLINSVLISQGGKPSSGLCSAMFFLNLFVDLDKVKKGVDKSV